MLQFSGVPVAPDDDTVKEKHGADAMYSAVNSSMRAIWNEDEEAQRDTSRWMIKIAIGCAIRRWPEWKLADGNPYVRIPEGNAYMVDLTSTEDDQAKLKALVERYTSRGSLGAWRVPRWRLTCLSLVLGNMEDRHNMSGQRYDESAIDSCVDLLIFR